MKLACTIAHVESAPLMTILCSMVELEVEGKAVTNI